MGAKSLSSCEVILHRIARLTDSVLVGVSGGKDSIATLGVCRPHFRRIVGYFMYQVPDLEFQERYLRYCERRFEIEIMRIPHFAVCDIVQAGYYRPFTDCSIQCPSIGVRDIEDWLRDQTGISWIATGEKAADSIQRNAMIRKCDGVQMRRRRFYPLAAWKDATVYNYMKRENIPLPPEYVSTTTSFGEMSPESLIWVRERYPEDFDRIRQYFPFMEASIRRYEYQQTSEI